MWGGQGTFLPLLEPFASVRVQKIGCHEDTISMQQNVLSPHRANDLGEPYGFTFASFEDMNNNLLPEFHTIDIIGCFKSSDKPTTFLGKGNEPTTKIRVILEDLKLVIGTIKYVPPTQQWYYLSCNTCPKGVKKGDTKCNNDKGKDKLFSPKNRFRIHIRVQDPTSIIDFPFFLLSCKIYLAIVLVSGWSVGTMKTFS